ncbi:hypothetical protein J6590_071311 [Homalodisca vitripennis]|nr:hypothetical protein J6590_071311 [Homalodisca vitripennis]
MSELPNSGRDIHWFTSGGRELPVRNRRYRCMNTCSHRQKFHKSLDIRLKSFLSSVFDNLNEFLAYNRIAQLYQHLLKNTKRVTKLPQYRDHENQHNTRGLEDTEYIHTARPISKFYRGRWSLGTKIRRGTSTLCSSHLQVLPRALVTWYLNSSKDIHTVLVPFASSTEGAGHLVPKFVEGHPHCARPICKFYRGRWTSTLCSSHLQVLPRALVTWYINSSKDIHTVLVPFASSTEDAGHLVPKFVEVHPHSSSHLQVLLRALVTWYQNSSKDIHTVLVPFASSTEGAGHLVPKFVEGHPHCARLISNFYRGRWSLGTKICRSTSTLLVPFPSSTEGAGHLVHKFVEGHPHCARPICKFY